VHRDIKPGNIFIENGTVKVGDYGLSKAIGTSQHTAQTQSVGTVHYMAPEISTGNYNKQIDTYAAGVVLYEMLTGRVPFDGESCGEILMKHLTAPPDLSKVSKEWAPIVAKALSKNPTHRYAGMAEMARDVEAIGRGASPSREARAAAPRKPEPAVVPVRPVAPGASEPVLTALPAVSRRAQVMELCGSMALTVLFAGLATALWGALALERALPLETAITRLSGLFFLTVASSWAILIPGKFWTERRGDSWTRRLVMMVLGGLIGLGALWLQGWSPGLPGLEAQGDRGALTSIFPRNVVNEASYFSYYALAFFALRWWRMTSRRRQQRFSFAPILAAGFWGVVLWLLVHPQNWSSAVVLVLASAIVQLVSPWEPPPPPVAKRVRLRYA
jgi:hypothetical protein